MAKQEKEGYSQNISIQSDLGGIPVEVSNISIDSGTMISISIVVLIVLFIGHQIVKSILDKKKSSDNYIDNRIDTKMIPIVNDINYLKEEQTSLHQKQAITANDVQDIKQEIGKMSTEMSHVKKTLDELRQDVRETKEIQRGLPTEFAKVFYNLTQGNK